MTDKKTIYDLYIGGDIATKSGIIYQLKKDNEGQESRQKAGDIKEMVLFLTKELHYYLYTQKIMKLNTREFNTENKFRIKFYTYHIPYVKFNPQVMTTLSRLVGYYAGLVKGFFNVDTNLHFEFEKTVAKAILGKGNLSRLEKKNLTKKVMKEENEDLADAKMLRAYVIKHHKNNSPPV